MDSATQLRRLLDWLQMQLRVELPNLRRQVDPRQDSKDLLVRLQDLNVREQVYTEILQMVEELGSGSNPNRIADFLGADELPPAIETREIKEL